MQIKHVDIAKFRSIEHVSFDAKNLAVLCGANSSGKSNVLRAIRFAFVPEYVAERMANNFPLFITGGNAMIRVKLTFDEATPAIATALSIPTAAPWTYEVNVKRSGFASYFVNGTKITPDVRSRLLEHVWVVFVPPIRDISGDGLLPFRRMLGDAIRQARGGTPVAAASSSLRNAVTNRGAHLLAGNQFPAIGHLEVDVADVDFESMLSEAAIKVRTANGHLPLHGFGTGHQSQVVLGLYRQFGQGSNKFVIFQFEEPDNHMHTTAMRAIAEDMLACSAQHNAQVFITTHSPALMNQFELRSAVALVNNNGKTEKRSVTPTISDREYRVGLSQFGMRPAEALTARLVIVVEGATDVTLIRTIYRRHYDRDPERDDVLIVPAGGKEQAIKLCAMLNELGVSWRCVLDFDAAQNESKPHWVDGLTAPAKAALTAAIDSIMPHIYSSSAKAPKSKKILTAMKAELAVGASRPIAAFNGSPVARIVDQLRALSAVERSVVAKAVGEGRLRKWRQPLLKSNVWLWSADPEALLVQTDAVLSAAEGVLRTANILRGTFANNDKLREVVEGKLHDLAAEPDILEKALLAIFATGPLGTDQFNALGSSLKV